MKTEQKALMPEYMQEFKCIGAACEDTCCAGWRVSIDKETFGKYQSVLNTELSMKFKSEIAINQASQRTSHDYARMNIDLTTGNCSFLEEGLCSIQAKLGEEYLSHTCATYPRLVNIVDGDQEVSTQLSCPEAARVALLNTQGIQFSYEPKLTQRNIQIISNFSTKSTNNKLVQAFWDYRIAAIRIIQDRRYRLEHRFMQLAVLSDQIQDSLVKREVSIPNTISNFLSEMEEGKELKYETTFPVNPQFQLSLLNKILLTVLERKLWQNRRYGECLKDYLAGMDKVTNEHTDQTIRYFESIKRKYYDPFIERHEYIFENYIVNYIFSTIFPLTNNRSVFENTCYLGIIFSLLRTQLIGMSSHHGGISTELVVKLIQSFTKNFEHTRDFRKLILDICEEEQVNALGPLSLVVMVHSS